MLEQYIGHFQAQARPEIYVAHVTEVREMDYEDELDFFDIPSSEAEDFHF